jgi:hypothetical protein
MRVLICGSRDFFDAKAINNVISKLKAGDVVIQGKAPGADTTAENLAEARGDLEVQSFPAEWHKYGKRAGPIRNQQMLDEGKPDVVFAFYTDKKGSKGTADMVRRSKKAGIVVVENK